MARSAVSAGARSTGGCAEHLRLRSHRAPRCWRHPAADSRRWPTTPTPRSVRTVCTRVRGTGRGRYPRPVGEDPGQSAEPPSRGPRRPPIGGGFTWAHSWAHTVDAPPPHLRTRAGVADVPPGRVGNPEARRQPPGASANEASPAQRCGTAPSPRKPTVRPAQSAPYARNSMSVRRPELERLFPAPPPGTLPCPCRGRREPGRR